MDPSSQSIQTHAARLPSSVASNNLEALVASLQLAMTAASSQLTYIGRLSQARIMGCDTSYADKGLATLKLELAKVTDEKDLVAKAGIEPATRGFSVGSKFRKSLLAERKAVKSSVTEKHC